MKQFNDQISNVARLPGIAQYAFCMPDRHFGYGFPIGRVAAMDVNKGSVISPGGIGFDINYGMCLVKTCWTGFSSKYRQAWEAVVCSKYPALNFAKHIVPTGRPLVRGSRSGPEGRFRTDRRGRNDRRRLRSRDPGSGARMCTLSFTGKSRLLRRHEMRPQYVFR